MKVYNEEHRAFFLEFIPGHTDNEVANEFNRRFDIKITPSKVHAYKQNNRIKSGTKKGRSKGESELFPRTVRDYIRANNSGKTAKQMADLLNRHFNTSYTSYQIKGIRARMHLVSGLTGRFKKGHIPHNHVVVGTEVISTDGYLKIKIAEPNVWVFKHIMEWKKHHGSVPENCLISFKDGDHYNCKIENLMCITRAEHSILNFQEMRFSSPELTESALTVAKLKHRIREIQKEQK